MHCFEKMNKEQMKRYTSISKGLPQQYNLYKDKPSDEAAVLALQFGLKTSNYQETQPQI